MDRPKFESWRRWLARITLVWVGLFVVYTLAQLLSAFWGVSQPAEISNAAPQRLDAHRLLNQVLAVTMMPIASFAIYHFVVSLLARHLNVCATEAPLAKEQERGPESSPS
jgi:hypothetical protein